jgi:hypothetical protein
VIYAKNKNITNDGPSLSFEIFKTKDVNSWDSLVKVNDGDTISQKEGYVITVYPFTEMSLYILQIDDHGKLSWVFPKNPKTEFSAGANPVVGKKWLSLPQDTTFFLLDSNLGQETIYVIGANKPQFEIESKLNQLLSYQDQGAVVQDKLKLRGIAGTSKKNAMTVKFGGTKTMITTMVTGLSADGLVIVKKSFVHAR